MTAIVTVPAAVAGQAPGARRLDRRPVVLLVGFEPLFARLLYTLLRESALVEVVRANVPGRDALQAVEEHRPDATLLCWESVDAGGVQRVAQAYPDTGVVVLGHTMTTEQARALMRCGATAALERRVSRPVLSAAMVLAGSGMRMEPRNAGARRDPARSELSEREAEVLGLLDCGESLTAIAALLGVSRQTVKTQTRSIYRKLGVHSRTELRERRRDPLGEGANVLRLECARSQRARAQPAWLRPPLPRRHRHP